MERRPFESTVHFSHPSEFLLFSHKQNKRNSRISADFVLDEVFHAARVLWQERQRHLVAKKDRSFFSEV